MKSNEQAKIIVLGSLHMDVIVNAPDRPRKGETLAGHAWRLQPGGKGGNQAVQAAQQGAYVLMIGRVGRDDFGDKQLIALRDAGVDTTYVTVDDTTDSGMSVAIVDEQGDYGAVIVSGANLNIGPEDLEAASAAFHGAHCLLLQYEVKMDTVLLAARFAKQHGVSVILNAAPAYTAPANLLENVDVLVVNEVEAEMIDGSPVTDITVAKQIAQRLVLQVPTVIITLGGQGVVAASQFEDELLYMPAYEVDVVDTHGAGDAFIGAFATQHALRKPLAEAIAYANAAGALMVMNKGPQAKNTSPDRVASFMQSRQ